MTKAGENESSFKSKMGQDENNNDNIRHKLVFGAKKKANISVDGHFIHNNKLYLLEIDSGNESKLLAGQYVLLYLLYDENPYKDFSKEDCVFLIIHYFKDYNPIRTEKTLKLLKSKLNISMDFIALHQDKINNWEDLLGKIDNNIK